MAQRAAVKTVCCTNSALSSPTLTWLPAGLPTKSMPAPVHPLLPSRCSSCEYAAALPALLPPLPPALLLLQPLAMSTLPVSLLLLPLLRWAGDCGSCGFGIPCAARVSR